MVLTLRTGVNDAIPAVLLQLSGQSQLFFVLEMLNKSASVARTMFDTANARSRCPSPIHDSSSLRRLQDQSQGGMMMAANAKQR